MNVKMPPNYCPLVRGQCRGTKLCDFWARVKLEKKSVEQLVEGINKDFVENGENNGRPLRKDVDRYWRLFGIKSMDVLSEEKPHLYAKIKQVEAHVLA